MATASQTPKVSVYVRLCGGDADRECRELSFRIPEKITQAELLEEGFAIDGNSATKSVVATRDFNEYVPLSDVLREAQLELVEWFEERDYQVEFK